MIVFEEFYFFGRKRKKLIWKKMCYVLIFILIYLFLNIINDYEVLLVIDFWFWLNCKIKSDYGVFEIWFKFLKYYYIELY